MAPRRSSGLTSSYQDVTDAAAVASCTLSQNNVEGKLCALIVNGTPVTSDSDKARDKCVKTVNGAGVKYALGALQTINKCLADQHQAGTAGNLAAICVGHWSGGAFVAPTDADGVDEARGPARQDGDERRQGVRRAGRRSTIEAIGACPGASSAADLENCLACETWDSYPRHPAGAVLRDRHVRRARRRRDPGRGRRVAVPATSC